MLGCSRSMFLVYKAIVFISLLIVFVVFTQASIAQDRASVDSIEKIESRVKSEPDKVHDIKVEQDEPTESRLDSSTQANKLSNIEALLNIAANSMEIWGFITIGSFFCGSIVAFVRSKYVLGALMLFMCPVSITIGLASPPILNWLIASARDVNWGEQGLLYVSLIYIPICLFIVFATGFFPFMLALQNNHPKKWALFFATFLGWAVPFGWPLLLLWAIFHDTKGAEGI